MPLTQTQRRRPVQRNHGAPRRLGRERALHGGERALSGRDAAWEECFAGASGRCAGGVLRGNRRRQRPNFSPSLRNVPAWESWRQERLRFSSNLHIAPAWESGGEAQGDQPATSPAGCRSAEHLKRAPLSRVIGRAPEAGASLLSQKESPGRGETPDRAGILTGNRTTESRETKSEKKPVRTQPRTGEPETTDARRPARPTRRRGTSTGCGSRCRAGADGQGRRRSPARDGGSRARARSAPPGSGSP